MGITKAFYGNKKDGAEVDIFTLTNKAGAEVKIINYGGTVVSLKVPDRKGEFKDVVLGYETLQDYEKGDAYFGALIGRFGNRIENATFVLDGVKYEVGKNSGKHQLHGGFVGFDKVVWAAEIAKGEAGEVLNLSYTSKDGEEGFPGELKVKVTYSLTEDNALVIDYFAVSDKDTVVNLTNHSYFNLAGHDNNDVLTHELMIDAESFTVIDDECIPNGDIAPVTGTPFDFTSPTFVGAKISEKNEQLDNGFGYDHNFILKVSGKKPEKFAELYEAKSGRLMEVYTTKPGVQFYSGNHVSGTGKDGVVYKKRSALCLETQFFPNSTKYNHFPSPFLKANETYKHTTIYKFSAK